MKLLFLVPIALLLDGCGAVALGVWVQYPEERIKESWAYQVNLNCGAVERCKMFPPLRPDGVK